MRGEIPWCWQPQMDFITKLREMQSIRTISMTKHSAMQNPRTILISCYTADKEISGSFQITCNSYRSNSFPFVWWTKLNLIWFIIKRWTQSRNINTTTILSLWNRRKIQLSEYVHCENYVFISFQIKWDMIVVKVFL